MPQLGFDLEGEAGALDQELLLKDTQYEGKGIRGLEFGCVFLENTLFDHFVVDQVVDRA